MPEFRKSAFSSKHSACRRLAEHTLRAALAMGLRAEAEPSRQSASHYVYVATYVHTDDEDDEYYQIRHFDHLKIRCSDHTARQGDSDIYAWAGQCPSEIIAQLADAVGVAVPDGYSCDDYRARSGAAKAAAATREHARQMREADMVATIKAALEANGRFSVVAARKAIDQHYPSIPKAQRRRIAFAASFSAPFDVATMEPQELQHLRRG